MICIVSIDFGAVTFLHWLQMAAVLLSVCLSVCRSVCVWQRPVVFPALSLFTRRPLWLRAAAAVLEWNDGNIFALHAVSYHLNIDSVKLFFLHVPLYAKSWTQDTVQKSFKHTFSTGADATFVTQPAVSHYDSAKLVWGDHFEFDPQETEATTVSRSQICMFRFLLHDLSKPMIQL